MGYFGKEKINFEQGGSFETIIGCALRETGEFKEQVADGIFGLSNLKNQIDNAPPFILDIMKS